MKSLYTKSLLKGLVLLVCGFLLTSFSYGQNVNTYIPERAFDHRSDLYNEIKRTLPDLAEYNFVPALIEHESCISLKHSRCWSSTSTLSNKREHSVGFFQIAKAYNADGSTRMDTLQSLKNKYTDQLKELSWNNIAQRPELQMRAGLLLIKDNDNAFRMIKDPYERMYFVDNSYNGGQGWVQKERRACGMKEGCDPNKWFGNVELTCQRSKKKIPAYGNRSICDISRNHTRDVFEVRLPKYKKQYFNDEFLKGRK